MKLVILVLALTSAVLAGVIYTPLHTPNPNDILKQVHFYPLNVLDFAGNSFTT